jgi:hypothetical protein
MARITDCKYGSGKVGIDEALKLRDKKGERAFRCLSCEQPLVAHRGGSDGESHFEHARGSGPCKAKS